MLESIGAPAKLLWIGCGECKAFSSFDEQFSEILLVDARADVKNEIPVNLQSYFRQASVSFFNGISTFKETNIADLSSFSGEDVFLHDFPGLRTEREFEVHNVDLSSTFRDFFRDECHPTVIIDIPDLHFELISSLNNDGLLESIDNLILWDTPQPTPQENAKQLLVEIGFVPFKLSNSFHGYSWIHFVKNPWFEKRNVIEDLEKEVERLNIRLKEAITEKEDVTERLRSLQTLGDKLEVQMELLEKFMSINQSK